MSRAAVMRRSRGECGFSLLELMVALIVLSIGIFAVARLFPAGMRGQAQDRLQASASYLAQAELERLGTLVSTDTQLSAGRHPATGWTACGNSGHWLRAYTVSAMNAPISDLKCVTVTVTWSSANGRDVVLSTYIGS